MDLLSQFHPSKHTAMTHKNKDLSPYIYDKLHLLFLTTHYENPKKHVNSYCAIRYFGGALARYILRP